jgi:hypothetical protein
MQQVNTKKVYVEPKMAELGNISTLTLCLGGFSGAFSFKHKHKD